MEDNGAVVSGMALYVPICLRSRVQSWQWQFLVYHFWMGSMVSHIILGDVESTIKAPLTQNTGKEVKIQNYMCLN